MYITVWFTRVCQNTRGTFAYSRAYILILWNYSPPPPKKKEAIKIRSSIVK